MRTRRKNLKRSWLRSVRKQLGFCRRITVLFVALLLTALSMLTGCASSQKSFPAEMPRFQQNILARCQTAHELPATVLADDVILALLAAVQAGNECAERHNALSEALED